MDYRVAFDITAAGYKSWPFPAGGVIFIAVGALLVALRKHLPGPFGRRPAAARIFTSGFLGFAVLWTLLSFFMTYREYSAASSAARDDRARVVEGLVTHFIPMPVTGHAMESFCVSDACFNYSDYVMTAGFNTTSSHGGPIREGLPVRVTYLGNTILKLEVAK